MLSSFLKVSSLFGAILMMAARCSLPSSFNGGGNNSGGKNGYNFISVNAANKGGANLQISERLDGEYGNSTGISKNSSTPFDLYTFENLPEPSVMDNEDTPYNYGITTSQHGVVYEHLKCTFYAKNFGASTLEYKISLRFTESGSGIVSSDIMRVALYENDANNDEHECYVYAKESATGGEEYISNPESGYAQKFAGNNLITERYVSSFLSGDVMRYTFVVWMEGFDPEATGTPSSSTNLTFQIDIAAKEE